MKHEIDSSRENLSGNAVLRAMVWVLVGALVMLFLVVDPLGVRLDWD